MTWGWAGQGAGGAQSHRERVLLPCVLASLLPVACPEPMHEDTFSVVAGVQFSEFILVKTRQTDQEGPLGAAPVASNVLWRG